MSLLTRYSEEVKTVLNYFIQVLGLQSVNLPADREESGAVQMEGQLYILCDRDKLTEEGKQLADKMIKALNLADGQMMIFNNPQGQMSDLVHYLDRSQIVLSLGSSFGEWVKTNYPHLQVFQTPSPDLLNQQAELKKQAWGEMQKARALVIKN